jgi:hypothetical protein
MTNEVCCKHSTLDIYQPHVKPNVGPKRWVILKIGREQLSYSLLIRSIARKRVNLRSARMFLVEILKIFNLYTDSHNFTYRGVVCMRRAWV